MKVVLYYSKSLLYAFLSLVGPINEIGPPIYNDVLRASYSYVI